MYEFRHACDTLTAMNIPIIHNDNDAYANIVINTMHALTRVINIQHVKLIYSEKQKENLKFAEGSE